MVAAERRPLLMVVAGPNGSGKTLLTTQVLESGWGAGVEYINPDNIAQQRFGSWNDADAVLKAARYAAALRERCLAERRDIAFETVLSTAEKVDFVRRASEAAFFVRVFFICTDSPTINAARIARRVMEGGHDVPIGKIISRYDNAIVHGAEAAALADRAYVYDNSIDGQAPTLLFRAVDGRVRKLYQAGHQWAEEFKAAMRAGVVAGERLR